MVFVLGLFFLSANALLVAQETSKQKEKSHEIDHKIPVIFDTDANNELDDQHALAYLLFSGDHFKVDGITVNATYNGGEIDAQFAEAERVLNLCHPEGNIPLIKGANGDFEEIVAGEQCVPR